MSKIEVNTVEPQCGTTLTLGASGDTVTLGSGASQSGFGRTGTVDWVTTVQTSGFTAANGKGYFVNTTSGGITINLPAGSAGDIVAFKDYANTWDTNNVTVTPNGSDKIGGTNANAILNTESQSVTLVFIDSTKGWLDVQDSTTNVQAAAFISATGGTETTSGNFKIHTFTGPGTLCISAVGNPSGSDSVDYLVLAGGGGGGFWYGGGGGAGGYRFSDGTKSGCYTTAPSPLVPLGASALPVSATSYPITVGGGGTGGSNPPFARSTNGSNSSFSTITSAGGGGGGGNVNDPPGAYPTFYPGNPGGSGGGAKGNPGFGGTAGTGNTPSVDPPQGFPAGSSNPSNENNAGGGGAGAASNASTSDTPQQGGYGGAGIASCITASPVGRGGGGSGNGSASPYGNANPTGFPFGGGKSDSPTTAGNSGTVNTGGGGGAGPICASQTNAGSGGSGIVIIRYKFQ